MKPKPIPERDNETWIRQLSSEEPQRGQALSDLRVILLGGLKAALQGWMRTRGREFAELSEDFTQEALLQILAKLDTFRNLSRFTTWAHKICIRVALTELRRKRWQDSSLDLMAEQGRSMPDKRTTATEKTLGAEMGMKLIMKIMAEELSDKQMSAINAVAINGMPLEEAARRLGTNRNALYKCIHDARVKLKMRMKRDGITMDDLAN